MNLVELESVSGPRVKRGCAVEENSSNRTTADDCSRRSADAEIGVRRYRVFFGKCAEEIERMGDSESLSLQKCGTVRAGRSEAAISTNQGPTSNPC